MPTTEGSQSPLIPVTEGQDGYIAGQTDRRRNRYWQFVASISSRDPGSGRIFVELQSGGWRLIDSEEIEAAFKENIRRNSKSASDGNTTDSSPTFNIKLGETDLEKKKGMKRYRDLEKWMWKECLYMPSLSAMTHGKQRSTPLQGICEFCHGSYCFEKKTICPRCYRSFSTLGDKLCYTEPDIQDNVRNSNDQNDWDITHPIRIRYISQVKSSCLG
ncbi:HB1/Asxl, restriction endonuclease HTH domain-containing protein [Artemisia annua]|uniref:HB1/Asxl, restriction endonuclease HTH domain-containing protein n=1 Tax=Artemisia annua TaxID=35608 RepID=A0A2U1L548_ARTAN|nr:HB1/Asxl, restriction endonuclease HTH domain-containing protein [Artemisia annua]